MEKIKIIYEDNHLLVVEKPVNILSQADYTGDKDMLTLLKKYIKDKYNKPGRVYLGLVHRLDRPVGGIMVFARTSKAASRLSEQIRDKCFQKAYLAITTNGHLQISDTLVHYLYKDKKQNKVYAVDKNSRGAKKAILDYDVLSSIGDLSLLKVQLHTGRSHQIRVQFQAIGHPLYGDRLYGTKNAKHGKQIALWAYSIVFKHPTRKEMLKFTLNPPEIHPWSTFNPKIYSKS